MGALLASIKTDSLIGLRDRALIGLMGYTFARIGAVLSMKVEDYYIQRRRGWDWSFSRKRKSTEKPLRINRQDRGRI